MHMLFLLATKIDGSSLPQTAADNSTVTTILNIILGIAGGLGLVMITVSGLRYVTSAGDPQKAASAKSGIIAALVGIAIVLAAGAILNFVVGQL